jgi:murein DD-endopeptidase MepM/ murein hydrolase activator NlpD
MADGVIVRTGLGIAMLDLDGDGDERTGWNIFYLHLETATIRPVGTQLKAGERIGRPSCEGGHATGTHVHIARKYNGEWMLAEGPLAYNLEGWTSRNGAEPYEGKLLRCGSPRNDLLLQNDPAKKASIRAALGIPQGAKVNLTRLPYAATPQIAFKRSILM